jgi:hypothetical protein
MKETEEAKAEPSAENASSGSKRKLDNALEGESNKKAKTGEKFLAVQFTIRISLTSHSRSWLVSWHRCRCTQAVGYV